MTSCADSTLSDHWDRAEDTLGAEGALKVTKASGKGSCGISPLSPKISLHSL